MFRNNMYYIYTGDCTDYGATILYRTKVIENCYQKPNKMRSNKVQSGYTLRIANIDCNENVIDSSIQELRVGAVINSAG